MIFTNLHVIHDYYQVANLAFLLVALALIVGGYMRERYPSMAITSMVTLCLVASNVYAFSQSYGYVTSRAPAEQDRLAYTAYKVGLFLREQTQSGTGLTVFGQEYSSEIPFHSQRKAMVVPPWFKDYQDLWERPQKYLGDVALSAVVVCPEGGVSQDNLSEPTLAGMRSRYRQNSEWDYYSIQGCELAIARRYATRAK
jgi:hypothetical protein